jgi:hypothetical protein
MDRRARSPLGLVLVVATALLVGLWLWLRAAPTSQRFALSPQECNTECQRQQTDCILACDGNVPCERRCTKTGQACVEGCLQAADAGAGSSGGRGGGGGSRGRRRP